MKTIIFIVITTVIIIISVVIILVMNKDNGVEKIVANMEEVILNAEDGVKIAADYYTAEGEKAVILIHQFAKDKNSWGDLPDKLSAAGFSVLAVDLRGHGESDGNYSDFSERDFRDGMPKDVQAAKDFLAEKGKTDVSVIGSSIGANLALNELEKGIRRVVAISPGLNFKGIVVRNDFTSNEENKALIIASADDEYSFESAGKIKEVLDSRAELLTYEKGGHGTALLSSHPELKEKILYFLSN